MPWAHGQALSPRTRTPTARRVPARGRRRDADQRVDLLRLQARDGRRARDGELGLDARVRAQRALALEHARGDVAGEVLDRERVADHDRLDRLGEQLGEARHVHALLGGVEIDRALDVGVVERLVAAVADPDDLVQPGHARLAQRQVHRRARGLDVLGAREPGVLREVRHDREMLRRVDGGHDSRTLACATGTLARVSDDPPGFPEQISAACHDLRTPLASAYGFARTLERLGAVEGDHARYLSLVVEATEELGRLIDCLALLARAQDGRIVARAHARRVARARGRRPSTLVPGGRLSVQGAGATVEVDARACDIRSRLARRGRRARRARRSAAAARGARATARSRSARSRRWRPTAWPTGTGDLRALGALAVARVHGGVARARGRPHRPAARAPT